MSLPNVGDLCIIKRVCGCEKSLYLLGQIFRVRDMLTGHAYCSECDRDYGIPECVITEMPNGGFIRAWTQRIEPLSDQQRRHESARALLDAIERVPAIVRVRLGDE